MNIQYKQPIYTTKDTQKNMKNVRKVYRFSHSNDSNNKSDKNGSCLCLWRANMCSYCAIYIFRHKNTHAFEMIRSIGTTKNYSIVCKYSIIYHTKSNKKIAIDRTWNFTTLLLLSHMNHLHTIPTQIWKTFERPLCT